MLNLLQLAKGGFLGRFVPPQHRLRDYVKTLCAGSALDSAALPTTPLHHARVQHSAYSPTDDVEDAGTDYATCHAIRSAAQHKSSDGRGRGAPDHPRSARLGLGTALLLENQSHSIRIGAEDGDEEDNEAEPKGKEDPLG